MTEPNSQTTSKLNPVDMSDVWEVDDRGVDRQSKEPNNKEDPGGFDWDSLLDIRETSAQEKALEKKRVEEDAEKKKLEAERLKREEEKTKLREAELEARRKKKEKQDKKFNQQKTPTYGDEYDEYDEYGDYDEYEDDYDDQYDDYYDY